MWRIWMFCAVVTVSLILAVPARAGEVDALLNKLVEKGLLTAGEAQEVRNEMNPVVSAQDTELERRLSAAQDAVPDWAKRWVWKGDIRLRDEIRMREGGGGQADLHRQRIRFRYGFTAKVNDQLTAGARLATGGTGDPVSTNDTFNDTFDKKPVVLDQAYLAYAPEVPGISTLRLIGGVIGNPFWVVGPMVWDGDLSFDGVAMHLEQELGPATLFLNSGLFAIDSEETETASVWSAQSGVSVTPFKGSDAEALDKMKLTAAIAYHDYKNVANAAKAGTDILSNVSDNTSGAKDFNELNPSFEVSTQLSGMPVKTWFDWVHNASAGSADNDGYQVGLKLNKAKTPLIPALASGNVASFLEDGWEAGYFFQQLEADAAFDEFADSDFNGGGTNNRGHVFWVNLATLKNSTFGAKYFVSEALKGAKDAEDRVQLDWVTKF